MALDLSPEFLGFGSAIEQISEAFLRFSLSLYEFKLPRGRANF